VDASLGAPSDVGRISVIDGGVRAGAALCKNLPRAGNIGITATVAPLRARRSGNVRLAFVARLAETVAQALYLALGKTDAASGEAKSPPRAVNI
ncbi:MAG: DUF1256 domain-containing protein, partial [Clostridiales bacterium]|jgi:putative sporulation protein YyaC|nr:DUF1256 domain-containing protein [Clostridiales bacterium]